MKLDIKPYERAIEEFARQCPMWYAEAINFTPKHNHMIRVYLKNGDCVDFNFVTAMYRYIDKSRVPSPGDISDEASRQIFSVNLVEQMQVMNISQTELSKLTGISQAMINKYYKGQSTPTVTNVKKIAHALHCSPYELME